MCTCAHLSVCLYTMPIRMPAESRRQKWSCGYLKATWPEFWELNPDPLQAISPVPK